MAESLARIIHEASTAAPDPGMSARFTSLNTAKISQ
jgi:hypothetical protein